MERNDGLDPLTMLTKSGTQAQSGGTMDAGPIPKNAVRLKEK
jgi:hypothetical protein